MRHVSKVAPFGVWLQIFWILHAFIMLSQGPIGLKEAEWCGMTTYVGDGADEMVGEKIWWLTN